LIKELTKNVEILNLTKESAKIESVKNYDSGAKSVEMRKNIKIKNPIKENINKYEFSKTLKELSRLINSDDLNEEAENIVSLISPWRLSQLKENKISYGTFKKYINEWYEEIKEAL